MKMRFCKKCNLTIVGRKMCPVCGKKALKTTKEELVFNGKKSSEIKRFPRLAGKAEQSHQKEIDAIEQKCLEFDVAGRVTKVKEGPVVTEFDFVPKSNVRVKRIRGMNEDIAMALGREGCSITRLIGESAVAIMLPNLERKMPTFTDTLKPFLKYRKDMEIPLNLGVDSLGNPIVVDLARLPHLLVAGETGSGKSVFLNTMITSLLWAKSPKQLKLMLIDSKQVELSGYEDIPHIDGRPATTVWEAIQLMERAEQEVRKRMGFINLKNAKNLKELNAKLEPEERLPYIVIIIDEMADLIFQERKEFTKRLAIIANMARAAGIHMIAATQRPSVDVLSGKIKVNFPARVAFHVPSSGDSKTIIMTKGAEQLLTRGDAFAIIPERSGLTRIHIPHIKEEDIRRILRASIAVGHHLKVPAEMTDKELNKLNRELVAAQKAQIENDGKSIADLMEESSKLDGEERVN